MSETSVGYAEVGMGLDEVLDSSYDLRAYYERIDHPEKDKVLATLASISPVPAPADADQAAIRVSEHATHAAPEIAGIGLKYFGLAVTELARDRAKVKETERLKAEFESLTWSERDERGWWSVDSIKVDTDSLVLDTASLDIHEVSTHLITRQMRDAFNVAYQGEGRLPFMMSYGGGSVEKLLTAGIIIAKHVGGLTRDELFEAASKIGGATEMVAGAYRDFVGASKLSGKFLVNGTPAGYEYTPQEAGYGIYRSRRGAAHYILDVSGVFWGGRRSWYEDDSEKTVEKPKFTRKDVIHAAQDQTSLGSIIGRREYFDELDPDLFVEILHNIEPNSSGILLEGSYGPNFEQVAEAFGLSEVDDPKGFVLKLLSAGHSDVLWDFYRTFKKEPITAMEIFRANIDANSFVFTESIIEGNLTDEHHALGITEVGTRGIEQLKSLIYGIQSFIAKSGKTAEEYGQERERIEASELYGRLWKAAVRFDQAVWGTKTSEEIIRILSYFEASDEKYELAPAPLDKQIYIASDQVQIAERNSANDGMNPEAEKVIDKFCEIAKLAWSDDEYLEDYNDRLNGFHREVLAARDNLIVIIDQEVDPKKVQRLTEELRRYENIADGNYLYDLMEGTQSGGFMAAYEQLGSIKMAKDVLREKALREAKAVLGEELEAAFKQLLNGEIVASELTAATNVIDHLVVQEFLLKLKPGDKQFEWFVRNELFNTSIVRAEIDKTLNSGMLSSKTRAFQFIPNRDIGLELSGQIGDACWASKYGSIAEQMPNLTAVLMSEHTGDQQKFVGSGLFIEATSESGEELLIVRGLNPIENVINQLDSVDFLNRYLEFAKETASRAGRKLAIVYDHVSGASTNRPALHGALTLLKGSERLTQINVSPEQVRFNGYSLEDSIFIVD